MATLYWGGGTGTWDGFTTTNWYSDFARTTLAGRAPAADDDVIFDSSSNATAYTVTISNNTTVCRSCTISGPASGNITLAGSGRWYIYGDLSLPASGITRTYTGRISFYASDSRTITTNGVTLASVIDILGTGTFTLQDALNIGSSSLNLIAGTLNTNDKNLTCGTISSDSQTVSSTLTLGSSTVSATSFDIFLGAFTLNAGTSNITLSSSSASIRTPSSVTFYNVTLSSTALGLCTIDSNTFNNLTFTTPAASTNSNVSLTGNITVNGTLTISGADGSKRFSLISSIIGTPRTLTVSTVSTLTDVDFRDITVAGASSPWSGTRLGDCKGNTNITFVAGANKYIAAATASSNWFDNIWATSSGGSASTANFPLAQDTVIIDNAGLNTSTTLTLNRVYNIGTIDASSRTNAVTFTASTFTSYGDINVSTNVTTSVSGTFTFAGRNTQNLTTNGKNLPALVINSPGGTVKYIDNYTGTGANITLNGGTLDLNNKNITCNNITVSSTIATAKTLTLGSGTITTTTGVFTSAGTPSNFTFTSNTATITCSSTSCNIGFAGLTSTFGGNITASSAGSLLTIYGTTTVANLTLTAPTTTGVTDKLSISTSSSLTVTGTLALAGGTSVTQRAFIGSQSIGNQTTISAATVTGLTDIDFRDISASGTANWTTGTRLGDCGNNANITFDAAKTVYWNLAGTNNWSATAWATGSGGTPAVNNFPLAQDTAVFDDTGSVGTVTMNATWNIGTISAGSRTSAWTLSGSNSTNIYGDITYGSGITSSITGAYRFRGRGTQTLTTAGKSVANTIEIQKPTGTFRHGDAYTSTSGGDLSILLGTYDTQNYNVTLSASISSNNSNVRSIIFGTSTITTAGADFINFTNSTNLTFSGASSTIICTRNGNKTINGGGQEFGTLTSTSATAGVLTISGNNKFNTLSNTDRIPLILTSGSTQEITTFSYTGASGNVVRVYSTVPGQRASIRASGKFFVGSNSTDGGNNLNLTFTAGSVDYLYIKDISYIDKLAGGGQFIMFFI